MAEGRWLKALGGNALLAAGLYAAYRGRMQVPVFPLGSMQARHPDDLNAGIPARFDGAHPFPGRFYFEWWYFDAEMEDGHKAVCVIQRPDLRYPLKRDDCVMMLYIQTPQGEGDKHYVTFPLGELRASTRTCDIRLGENIVRGECPHWELRLGYKDIRMELDFRNLTPGWARGTGSVVYGNDRRPEVLGWVVPQPRAEVSGVIEYAGRRFEVRGQGYHDHNFGSALLFKYVKCWHWGRLTSGDLTLIYADVTHTKRMGHLRVPCLLIARGDRLLVEVGEGTEWRMEAEDYVPDEQGVQVYPRHLNILFRERDVAGELDLRVRRVWETKETMSVLGSPGGRLQRALGRMLPTPCYYRFITDFRLDLEAEGRSETYEGETITEYMILSLRRGQLPPDGYHLHNPPGMPSLVQRRWGEGG